jgi:hypothetical protein
VTWWLIPLILASWAIVWFVGYMYGETCGWLQHAEMCRENALPRCTECGPLVGLIGGTVLLATQYERR